MGQHSNKSIRQAEHLWESKHYYYHRELNGFLEIRLPPPNSQLRLIIFHPEDYPYLWLKYTDGLQREYSRMQVQHIIPDQLMKNPQQSILSMLVIDSTDCIAGLRIHGPYTHINEVFAFQEMQQTDTTPLQVALQQWLPDGVVEPKGLWVDTRHHRRKTVLELMMRCGIYAASLLHCRYSICTSAQGMTRTYQTAGLNVMTELGTVPYPDTHHQTSCGYFDTHDLLINSQPSQKALLTKEWSLIQQAKQGLSEPEPTQVWRAPVLDTDNPFYAELLAHLQQDEHYQLQDTSNLLQQEIQEMRFPPETNSQQESTRWVLYPWRQTAVQILGPRQFQQLRLDRNRNKITRTEQQKLRELVVGVVGLSTGNVIAHTLAMEGLCGSIRLADFDTLALSNLNRIPASVLDIGLNKTVIAARRIAELDPYIHIDILQQPLTEDNIETFIDGLDIIIEECDSLDVKLMLREVASRAGIPVLMATSDQGLLDIERFDLNPGSAAFHGLTQANSQQLHGLSRKDKAGYALDILQGEQVSARLGASMAEIDYSLNTWPQLASDVTLGAAMIGHAIRRMGTQQETPSSRIRIDMDALLKHSQAPKPKPPLKSTSPASPPRFSGHRQSDILLAAHYAPSPGNIQPWQIQWQDKQLNINLDKALTTHMDVKWRGAYTAIGAAQLNAEIAAAHYQLTTKTHFFPVADQPEWVVNMHFQTGGSNSLATYFPYLLKRSTNRHLGEGKPLQEVSITALHQALESTSATLHLLHTPEAIQDYAAFSVESDRMRYLHQHLHQEMMQELVWPGKDSLAQGIDIRTLELDDKGLNTLTILQRHDVMQELAQWQGGQALGEYHRDRLLNASAIAIISIPGDTPQDYVLGGKAMQHCWLQAEMLGLAVQPISPIILYANTQQDVQQLMQGCHPEQAWALRQQFNHLVGLQKHENPVIVMRLNHAPAPSVRSRRRHMP